MGRTSYTLSEVIFGMRKELLAVQDSLNELKTLTYCPYNRVSDYHFQLTKNHNMDSELECVFFKKRNFIQREIDRYKESHYLPVNNYERGTINLGGEDYVAKSKHFGIGSHPSEASSFYEKCDDIIDSKYARHFQSPMLPMIGNAEEASLEFYLRGDITATSIIRNSCNAAIILSYNAFDDLITVRPVVTTCDNEAVRSVLNLRVARCMMPYYHQDVIEQNIEDINPLVLDGDITGTTKLTIEETDNRLVLRTMKYK